jgi:c(7)-type cytochrome triheme protein
MRLQAKCALALLVVLAAGCDPRSRHQTLSFVMDGVPSYEEWLNPPPSQPQERPTRRIHYRQQAPQLTPVAQPRLKTLFSEGRPEIEGLETWEEVASALPTNDAGQEDWQAALEQGIIAPFTSLEPGESELEAFEMEVELTADEPMYSVTFRHETHTAWLACDSCHPALFEMAGGTAEITMDGIYAGKHCGHCHGKAAFEVETGCVVCHEEMG